MPTKYNKNAVLTGQLDSFCLVCEDLLQNTQHIDAHIEEPVHKEALEKTKYTEKYKEDRIRKVKCGHYCEYCNIVLGSVSLVGLHIEDEQHILNKDEEPDDEPIKKEIITHVGEAIVLMNEFVISEKAWNSIIGDDCTLCDIEFEDENFHKSQITHILKLVQSSTKTYSDDNLFRRINEHFQCLFCNIMLQEKSFLRHFDSLDHKKARIQAKRAMKMINKVTEHQGNNDLNTTNVIDKTNSKDSSKVDKQNVVSSQTEVNHMKLDNANIDTSQSCETLPTNTNSDNPNDLLVKDNLHEAQNQGNSKSEAITATPENKVTESETENSKEGYDDYDLNKKLELVNFMHFTEQGAYCFICDWHVPHVFVVHHSEDLHHISMLKLRSEWITEKLNEELRKTSENSKTDEKYAENTNEKKIFNKENEREDTAATVPLKQDTDDENKTKIVESLSDFQKRASDNEVSTDLLLKKTAEDAGIVFNSNEKQAPCTSCKTEIPKRKQKTEEHIKGTKHRNAAARNKVTTKKESILKKGKTEVKQNYKSVLFYNFVEMESQPSGNSQEVVIINNKICISVLSKHTVNKINNNRLRCHTCDSSVHDEDLLQHWKCSHHEMLLNNSSVYVSFESELIREIRANILHCGVCNFIESGWEKFHVHLSSGRHKVNKEIWQKNLAKYLK